MNIYTQRERERWRCGARDKNEDREAVDNYRRSTDMYKERDERPSDKRLRDEREKRKETSETSEECEAGRCLPCSSPLGHEAVAHGCGLQTRLRTKEVMQ